ncbi:conserved Plasmodium protein, unknown function [Plasmodium chabaudi chabaudi]|uniref:GYF domain-containing protein n=1 Tax=Plasmodium chabaudi chabaudi TaxID=31271 RepID=A0A4V0K4W4_PLACU|nr:conserved Plasmodium protein, unknown function [Plasmodium chabaudi chabaudi]VTZ67492.1 conserved Plasmodium protein, unknown function [Plasmodium chabaudi chabaudi]|eukprot:XP_734332.2 conserved Plasmodium protein, unknown function [Plasmodium chabaudi chabaudi]
MLNEQSVEVDLKKIETELVSCHDNTEKTKKKKKVQFSEKNETLYYEKDENENSYFNFALNNFNYFESFYNRMYNSDFNDQEIQKYDTFLNDNDNDKILEYNDIDEEEDDEDDDVEDIFLKKSDLVNSTFKGVNKLKIDLHSKINKDSSNSTTDENEKNNTPYSKKDKFSQSFNEDCSFEINDIQSAIINAEEKTTYYNKDYFGYEIEPFNMKNELQEGYIDKDGNYIYHDSKNNKVEEAWLRSIDENESFSNNKLQSQINKQTVPKPNNTINTDIYDNSPSVNIYDALYSLSCLLADKETPIKAMVRYKSDLKNCKDYLNQCKTNLEEAKTQGPQKAEAGETPKSEQDQATPNELQADANQSEENSGEKAEEDDQAGEKAGEKADEKAEEKADEKAEEKAEEKTADATQDEHKKRVQQLEEAYQKASLDYKTIERQFNNIIDLTQKLTNEYKNVYFITKNEFDDICKKLEECKENGDILWQLKWQSDVNNNIYGPYNYYDIYNFISLGIVSAANPILLRRVNNENKILENVWQSYDTVNYLNFVNNDHVKKKRKLNEINMEDSDDEKKEVDSSTDDNEYDIQNKKKKKKGLIQISKKKEKTSNEEDSDNEDDFENYGI